ncbi:MAG: 1-(5-phosphoribosyl)-5-[(5-phosphoribosylamino)methylideneamino]imidazole-4-carboxamide isomerase [Gammaproteobacteria bacterium]|nr:1-(5-phosphoribosyl)-5-[(5-phosphoribosylamino)methylideneamino]imidazole-4-carboxamide isomerase [Gammaproteobacteria bacterium]
MLLIPAIDLKDGKCVRLRQGRMEEATIFSDDPVAMAVHWRSLGARRLHIVDLDGAFAGEPRNKALIQNMVVAMGDIPVQVGGGVRTQEIVSGYLDAGVAQVIIGTKAIEDPGFLADMANTHPQRVLLGLDARDGKVAVQGWEETSSQTAVELAQAAASLPLAGIVYTDIDRDGMMSGLNVEATLNLAQTSGVKVIASGGVTRLDDLRRLKKAFATCEDLLLGAITGRAIYEGSLDVAQGQALLDAE